MSDKTTFADDASPELNPDGAPLCWEDCPNHDGKRCKALGVRAPEGHVCPVVADKAARDLRAVVGALQAIYRNDQTRHEHHQPRSWDGRKPDPKDGTRWLEPRELARWALRRLGAEVPDVWLEMRQREAARVAEEVTGE